MAPEAGPETKKAGKEHEVLQALEGLMLMDVSLSERRELVMDRES